MNVKFWSNTWTTVALLAGSLIPGSAMGQVAASPRAGARPGAKAQPNPQVQAIEDEYQRLLHEVEKHRLEQLSQLAARQSGEIAAATYERLFRLAIETGLFKEAESYASKVVKEGTTSSTTNGLAHLVKMVAEVDRGAYEESLASMKHALADSGQAHTVAAKRAFIAPSEVIEIFDVYYQRLVDTHQYAIARAAIKAALEQPFSPPQKDFLASRLKRLELIGQPAPAIEARDLDGKPFSLAAQKGRIVLVIFWASWCLPNAAETAWVEELEQAYHRAGLEVVGINVDTQADGGSKLETVLPNIKRFLLDYNVPWPTIVNGTGDKDFAAAYGVSDIPASVLIGADGKVIELDLSRKNLEATLARLVPAR